MKITRFRLVLFTLGFSIAPLAPMMQAAPHEETELGQAMSDLNGAWRKLRRQAGDAASNASSLELVATIKAASEKSATLSPDKAKDIPEADRAKYVAAYQAKMKEFLGELDKLAAAFKANDNATAQELIKKLNELQREGHKEYRRPEH